MKRSLVAAAAVVLVLAGCGSSSDGQEPAAAPASSGPPPLAVVATTPEVADFVRNVGGDGVDVTQIMKPNVDPHDYEPTPADIQAIGKAKIIIKNGVGLEEWLDRTVESAGFDGTVIDSSQGVKVREGGHSHAEEEHAHDHEHEHEHEDEKKEEEHAHEQDPHIWHDPRNAKIMVANIEKGLATADPARASTFKSNSSAYAGKLDALDQANEAAFAKVPAAARKIVTNHDALGYYVDRYKLEFVGSVIPTLDTSAELSARQLDELAAKIKRTGAKVVFTESSLPPKAAETIARQAGVKVIGGDKALFGDSLGASGTPEGTYLGAQEHNTKVIVEALAG